MKKESVMSFILDGTNQDAIDYNISISDRLVDLCDPLKYLGLIHFGCLKFFKDGTYLKLSNNINWTKHYLINNLADNQGNFAEKLKIAAFFTLDQHLWPASKPGDSLSAMHDFGIFNGINFNIKSNDYIESFYFATSKDNQQVFNIYVSHTDLLKRFILYFKEKTADIFNIYEAKKLAMQKSPLSFVQAVLGSCSTDYEDQNLVDFKKNTMIKHYHLNGKYCQTYLTKRESECVKYLARGKSSKEIGKLTDLSPRTVESYINLAKYKTGSDSSSALVNLFLETYIKDVL